MASKFLQTYVIFRHITKEGYDLISECGAKTDLKIITQLLLDVRLYLLKVFYVNNCIELFQADIKDYGKAVLTTALNNTEINKVNLYLNCLNTY